MREYNYNKNISFDLNSLALMSNKKVWWKCSKCGFEWFSTIRGRTVINHGCPNCARDYIIALKSKKTIQLSTDGKIIATYRSAKEARQKTGIYHIEDVCNKKRTTAGGFKWKYEGNN